MSSKEVTATDLSGTNFCKDCRSRNKETKICSVKNTHVPRKNTCENFIKR